MKNRRFWLAPLFIIGLTAATPAALADQVEIVAVRLPPGQGISGAVQRYVTMDVRVTLTSRDNAILALFWEQFPATPNTCNHREHRTVGIQEHIITRGVNTYTIAVPMTPNQYPSGYLAPGANIWPYRGARVGAPGVTRFGVYSQFCFAFAR
jgi:hypothetical protein